MTFLLRQTTLLKLPPRHANTLLRVLETKNKKHNVTRVLKALPEVRHGIGSPAATGAGYPARTTELSVLCSDPRRQDSRQHIQIICV